MISKLKCTISTLKPNSLFLRNISHTISHGEECRSLRTIGCQQEYKQGFGRKESCANFVLYVAEGFIFTHEELMWIPKAGLIWTRNHLLIFLLILNPLWKRTKMHLKVWPPLWNDYATTRKYPMGCFEATLWENQLEHNMFEKSLHIFKKDFKPILMSLREFYSTHGCWHTRGTFH